MAGALWDTKGLGCQLEMAWLSFFNHQVLTVSRSFSSFSRVLSFPSQYTMQERILIYSIEEEEGGNNKLGRRVENFHPCYGGPHCRYCRRKAMLILSQSNILILPKFYLSQHFHYRLVFPLESEARLENHSKTQMKLGKLHTLQQPSGSPPKFSRNPVFFLKSPPGR